VCVCVCDFPCMLVRKSENILLGTIVIYMLYLQLLLQHLVKLLQPFNFFLE